MDEGAGGTPPIACKESCGRYALSARPIPAAASRATSQASLVLGFSLSARSTSAARSYCLCGTEKLVPPRASARLRADSGIAQGCSGLGGACATARPAPNAPAIKANPNLERSMHRRSNMLNLRLELFDGVLAQACMGFYRSARRGG